MRREYSRSVIGYHGCDLGLARKVLLGEERLASSINPYDWLGSGIYFWEHGPARAMQFATDESKRKPTKVGDPAVLGAYIFLGECFDLLDVEFTSLLATAYPGLLEEFKNAGKPLPENRHPRPDGTKAFHALDRAVLEYAIRHEEQTDGRKFDTVRGAFWEGRQVFPGSEVLLQSHIQISVRNPECILGYFGPKKR